ncbi:MAG TPA: hypothetical protein VGM91_10055 [Conexibacter sp.]|jgi:quercetin dioxygenase-like cupin family protein
MANGDVVTDPTGGDVMLGEVGTEILFENEHVRVWEVHLEPGEVQEWHLHDHPYLVLAIEEAHNVMEYLDGTDARTMHETVGRVIYRPAGKVHKLTNVGETTYRNRLIELKHLGREDTDD